MKKAEFKKYLENKDLAPFTIKRFICNTELFIKRVKKEEIQITKVDILKHLEHLKNRGLKNNTRKIYLLSLTHYFTFLYESGQITENPCLFLKIRGTKQKHLYKIYTIEELDQLFDNYFTLFVRGYDDTHVAANIKELSALSRERNALILSFIIYQKADLSELEKLETNDIDLFKATVKLKGSRNSNERIIHLKATQTGFLMHYLQNIRPKMAEYRTNETEKLFFAMSGSANNDSLHNIAAKITNQIKTFDKKFLSFKHLRASIISYWIKTYGLRKAQYLAGHRYVSSTETYLPNNLDDLKEDINKMHPF